MATETVNDSPVVPVKDAARKAIACNATYEIDALLEMLSRESERERDGFDLVLRSTLVRVSQLNGVAMSVVGDNDYVETSEMHKIVFGKTMEAAAAASDVAAIPAEADFNAGRDLAFAYVREAIEADANPPFEDRACFATGILRKFIERLTAQPELIDGFDAYLTSIVGVLDHSTPIVDAPHLTHGHVYGPDFDFIPE